MALATSPAGEQGTAHDAFFVAYMQELRPRRDLHGAVLRTSPYARAMPPSGSTGPAALYEVKRVYR